MNGLAKSASALTPCDPRSSRMPGGGVLRDPGVVHDVDVERAALLLAVVEGLREERVVRLGQELDRDPRLLLEQRDHLLLERRQRAVLERADDQLSAARAARGAGCGSGAALAPEAATSGPAASGAAGDRARGAAAPRARARCSAGELLTESYLRLLARSDSGRSAGSRCAPSDVKKHAHWGSTATPTGVPMGAVNAAIGAGRDTRCSPSSTSTSVSLPMGSTT